MVPAIRPVSMTVLPPLPVRSRRPGAVEALPPVAPAPGVVRPGVEGEERWATAVEPLARLQPDSAARAGFAVRGARSVGGPGSHGTLETEVITTLHAFAETRGLTLNRHPEAANAYSRAQSLVEGGNVHLKVSA